MKRIFFKSLSIGKYTLTIFPNEISLLIISNDRAKIHTFKTKKLRKYAFLSIFCLLLLTGLFLYPFNDKKTYNNSDEEMKNNILLSKKTDFSKPVINKKLKIITHVVKKGENLTLLAKKYGVSVDTICGTNNLRSYHLIREGAVFKIPNKDGIIYTIKKGNRILEVAKKYKVSVNKIIAENNIINPDFISPNIMIFIPDAKPQNVIRGFMWPTRSQYITCGFGWRRSPFNWRYREFHRGLDIKSNYEWIRSVKYGKVTYTGWMGGYGKAIVIAHPQGWKTLYAHLSRIIVRRGQYVKQGQIIARSGNTGRSTGAHLHFEMLKYGKHQNPYYYLKRGW